jgi:Domain of unknown function (DUF4349)
VTQLPELLREARPIAPAALRERVLALATEPAAGRRSVPLRRLTFALAAAALVGIAVAGAIVGLTRSPGGPSRPQPLAAEAVRGSTPADSAKTFQGGAGGRAAPASPATFPPSTTRFQDYRASLQLQVEDAAALSDRTKRAMRIARRLGGFVSSVSFGTGGESGSASLVLRIPTPKVPVAVEQLSELGRIVGQNVSIVDVQRRIDALRARVERSAGEARAAAQRELQRQLRQARLSSVALSLQTPPPVAAKPHHESRLHRTLRIEGEIALYGLVIGGPIAVLLALLWLGWRTARRVAERRLLGA